MRQPEGLVYRTQPREAQGTDGHVYMIKGPAPAVVFAEHAAYELARQLGVPVPEYGLCMDPSDGQVYFASRRLLYRLDIEILLQAGVVENVDMLAQTAVFDIWIANNDRHISNIVAGDAEKLGMVRLYAIDFEGAHALRGEKDPFTIAAMDPRTFLPRERLGRLCKGQAIPWPICDRITELGGDALARIVEEWESDIGLPRVAWCERSITILDQRAKRIRQLVAEAWQ